MRHSVFTRTILRLVLGLAGIGAVAMASPPELHAQATSANLEVTMILASSAGSDIDPQLQSISQRLRTQFGQFSSFRMHGRQSVRLNVGQTSNLNVPGGRSASVTLQSVRDNTYELQVQVTGGATTVRSPQGGVFFIAGPSVDGGTLIIMVRS